MSSVRQSYYHRITITSTDPEAFIVKGGSVIDGSLTLGGQLVTTSGLNVGSTTPSTSFTEGALVLVGGLSINNTEDATSYSAGGALSLAGGAAIDKKLLVRGTIATRSPLILSVDPSSNYGGSITWSMAGQSSTLLNTDPSTYTLKVNGSDHLQLSSRNSGNFEKVILDVDHASSTPIRFKSKQNSTLVAMTPNREDKVSEETFMSTSDVVSSPTNVTNLNFITSRGFVCLIGVLIDAATPLSGLYELKGWKTGSGQWQMMWDKYMGDNVPVTFSINDGQVQYTKTTTTGHVSTTMAWRVTTVFDL